MLGFSLSALLILRDERGNELDDLLLLATWQPRETSKGLLHLPRLFAHLT
jgi:hypothetical protein